MIRFGRGKKFALLRVRLYASAQCVDGIGKLIDILKTLVHRGVTQLSHLIDAAQLLQHLPANGGRLHFASTRLELVHDFIHGMLEDNQTDWPLLASLRHTIDQLSTIERFVTAVPLYHSQIGAFYLLVGGKAVRAGETFAATADTRIIARLARIDDFVITRPALGATHSVEARLSHQILWRQPGLFLPNGAPLFSTNEAGIRTPL